jgi:hypothetical protein|tara:strand:+ start:382 stop:555 length:174 start_codon:yes stop_codon:yes gene_type:complete
VHEIFDARRELCEASHVHAHGMRMAYARHVHMRSSAWSRVLRGKQPQLANESNCLLS